MSSQMSMSFPMRFLSVKKEPPPVLAWRSRACHAASDTCARQQGHSYTTCADPVYCARRGRPAEDRRAWYVSACVGSPGRGAANGGRTGQCLMVMLLWRRKSFCTGFTSRCFSGSASASAAAAIAAAWMLGIDLRSVRFM